MSLNYLNITAILSSNFAGFGNISSLNGGTFSPIHDISYLSLNFNYVNDFHTVGDIHLDIFASFLTNFPIPDSVIHAIFPNSHAPCQNSWIIDSDSYANIYSSSHLNHSILGTDLNVDQTWHMVYYSRVDTRYFCFTNIYDHPDLLNPDTLADFFLNQFEVGYVRTHYNHHHTNYYVVHDYYQVNQAYIGN